MRAALAIAGKDILLELRGREILVTLFIFGALCLTLFSMAAPPNSREMLTRFAPGVWWVTFLFAGVLGLGRTFDRERENDCFRGLLLCPVDPVEVYWGKCLSTLAFLLAFQALLFLPFCVFFGFSPLAAPGAFLTFLLGDLGFVALGVLLSSMTIHARGKEVVLPLLLLPLCLPVLLDGVRALASFLGAGGWGDAGGWLGRLAAFDAVFLSLGTFLFPWVVEE